MAGVSSLSLYKIEGQARWAVPTHTDTSILRYIRTHGSCLSLHSFPNIYYQRVFLPSLLLISHEKLGWGTGCPGLYSGDEIAF
jgi:hypothetical protein